MKKKLLVFAAVAALLALNGPAFTVTGEEALVSFQQKMNGVTVLKGSISMTFTNGRVYTGEFSYMSPGRIRVAFSNPKGKLIVSNGVQLWVYDEGEKICAVQNLGANLSGGIGAFVQGYAPLLTGSEGQPVIKLKGTGDYPDVTLLTDREYMMQRVMFKKSDGSGFSVDLTNLKTDGVSEADFNFAPPQGSIMVKGAMDF